MLAPGEEVEVDVTKEDQNDINSFRRNTAKRIDLKAEMSALLKEKEGCEDAEEALMLGDVENVRYLVGEAFVFVSNDEATSRLSDRTAAIAKELETKKAELAKVEDTLKALKIKLYLKFKTSINLEES